MRQYQPIWEAIKRNNHASLVAPIRGHRAIIKAVIKEKHKDEGYKLLLAEKCLRVRLKITRDRINKNLLTFSLITSINLNYVGINNL